MGPQCDGYPLPTAKFTLINFMNKQRRFRSKFSSIYDTTELDK